jgi:hypothetical protein
MKRKRDRFDKRTPRQKGATRGVVTVTVQGITIQDQTRSIDMGQLQQFANRLKSLNV